MEMNNCCVSAGTKEDREAQEKFRKWIAVQEERLNDIEANNDRLLEIIKSFRDQFGHTADLVLSFPVAICSRCSVRTPDDEEDDDDDDNEWNRTTNSHLKDPFIKWKEPYFPIQNAEEENTINDDKWDVKPGV
eukprot:Gb_37318 [translate_table: standard]